MPQPDQIACNISKLSDSAGHGEYALMQLTKVVSGWFSLEALRELFGQGGSDVEQLALAWLAKAGKRYRPLLTVGVYEALAGSGGNWPKGLQNLAIAVECFHKASLIHDDIEDGDDVRYGQRTLACEVGVGRALNVGDWLLGKGYQLLADWDGTDQQKAHLLKVASECHCRLCVGQGQELAWRDNGQQLSVATVLDIFRDKTSPAFKVALQSGAVAAGAKSEVLKVLASYSEALGIAYQIHDDIVDGFAGGDLQHDRPSLILALALEYGSETDRKMLSRGINRAERICTSDLIDSILANQEIRDQAERLFKFYRRRAKDSLMELSNCQLANILGSVDHVMFSDLNVKMFKRP